MKNSKVVVSPVVKKKQVLSTIQSENEKKQEIFDKKKQFEYYFPKHNCTEIMKDLENYYYEEMPKYFGVFSFTKRVIRK